LKFMIDDSYSSGFSNVKMNTEKISKESNTSLKQYHSDPENFKTDEEN